MKKLAIIVVIVLVLIAGGYFLLGKNKSYSDGSGSAENVASVVPEKTIRIANFAFSPAEIRIRKGEAVTWSNEDSVGHTVTSDSGGELGSSLLDKGQTYSHTFNNEGVFSYHCTPHPSMKAKVIVE